MLGITIGNIIGTKIVQRLRMDRLRIVIYAFLCLAGLATFITNI